MVQKLCIAFLFFTFLFTSAAFLPPEFAWASGQDEEDDEPPQPPLPPFILKARVAGPARFATDWQYFTLDAPHYADVQLAWDASFVGISPLHSFTYTSECQIRKYEFNSFEIVRSGVGLVGSYTFKARELSNDHRYYESMYRLYCKLRHIPPEETNPDNWYGKISDVNTSEIEIAVNRCESNFQGIAARLGVASVPDDEDPVQIGIVRITDDNFRAWASPDGFDSCEYEGFDCTKRLEPDEYYASGDKGDIESAMIGAQCSMLPATFPVGGAILDQVKQATDTRQPATFAVGVLSGLGNEQAPVHVLIGLNISKSMTNGLRYSVDALDSNGPTLIQMSCSVRQRTLPGGEFHGLVCDHPTLGEVIPVGGASSPDGLRSIFRAYCSSASQTPFCTSRQNMTGWLRNNYPQISNFTTGEHPGGVCYGWANFVLAVAYLGDFVGECPRP